MTRKHDLRLVPALATAWASAASGLALADAAGQPAVWAATAALVAAAVLAATLPTPTLPPLRAHLVVALVVAAAVGASIAVHLGERELGGFARSAAAGEHGLLHGEVVGPPTPAGLDRRWDATVEVRLHGMGEESSRVAVRARVVVLGDVLDLRRGQGVTLTGRLAALPPSSDASALVLDGTVLHQVPATGALAGIARARDRFLDLTDGLSPQGRALVPGVAVGDDTRLEDTLQAAMRRTSLSHLTAVSGSHVSLVIAVLVVALGRLARPTRVVAAALGLGCLVVLVGPEPSVVRSAAMASVALTALFRGRPPQAVPALAGGITLALVLDPWLALQLGFALSAAATAAIVLLTLPFTTAIAGTSRRRGLAMALAVPLAAGLACAPILVLLAPEVSLVGVLANALVTPVVAPSTVFGLLGVLLALPLPTLALLLAHVAEWCTAWLAAVALFCARLPFAAVPWPQGPGGALLLTLVNGTIVHLLLRLARHRALPAPPTRRRPEVRTLLALGGGAAAAGVLVALLLRGPDWVVWQCDVGQGSAMLVRSGPARAAMVDVGPVDGRSQDCLARAGVRHLDLLVLTHPHADHVSNLSGVLAAVPVDRILVSPATQPAAAVEWVAQEAAAVGRQVEVVGAGEEGSAGELGWRVLWPPGEGAPSDTNDLSVAVLLHAPDGTSALALGDLAREGQRGLARQLAQEGVGPVDVVAVAHHGAADQHRGLAEALAPTIALVSVGENTYGHPTRHALDLYEGVGAAVRRTDELGDIVVRVGGAWDAGSHG